MFRMMHILVAISLGVFALAPLARADQATPVRVALLDVSAVAPDQPTLGIMGPMMMGLGAAGPGMMGGGGFGGMGMGMMSVRVDRSTVKAGAVTFDVVNWSRSLVHEMLVVAVDGPNAVLPYDYRSGRVMEDQVKSLGETGEMQPNAAKSLTLDLPPGTYLLLCNVTGHYASGMAVPFTVQP